MSELEPVQGEHNYTVQLGAKPYDSAIADVRVGGRDKFVPNINASKWGGEAWMNLNLRSMSVTNQAESFTNGLIELTVGNLIWRSYVLPLSERALEVELEFATRPLLDEIRLEITDSENLSYSYQGELTQGQIDTGCSRSDRVVGSYAVYLKNRRNNEYKTGKFCHFYRWKVTDAEHKEAWCEPLRIENGELVIGLPTSFMDAAKYPVIAMGADDTLGYTVCGGSTTSWPANRIITTGPFMLAAGSYTINSFNFYGDTSGNNTAEGTMAVYDAGHLDYPTNLISYSDEYSETNLPGACDIFGCPTTITEPVAGAASSAISGGELYWMSLHFKDNNTDVCWDLGLDPPTTWWDNVAYGPPPPDPFPITGIDLGGPVYNIWIDFSVVTSPPPTSLAPTSLPPTSFAPTSLPPTSLAPTSLPPTSLAPTSLPPTSLAPTSLPPTSLPPTSLPPTSFPPTSLVPTTPPITTPAPPTTVPITTLAPLTTIAPTTAPPVVLLRRGHNFLGLSVRPKWH